MGRYEIYEKVKEYRALIFNQIYDKSQITIHELKLLVPEIKDLPDITVTKYLKDTTCYYPIEIIASKSPNRSGKRVYYLNYYGGKR